MSKKALSPKWQARFEQIENYLEQGKNLTRREKGELYNTLPFSTRFNWFAFIFGFFYYLFLGMWRKGLVLLVIQISITIVLGFFGEYMYESSNMSIRKYMFFEIIIQIIGMLLFSLCANFNYYFHINKGSKSWNPFEGMK